MSDAGANEARRKLATGALIVAATLRQFRGADAACMFKTCGFDAVIVDCEHGRVSGDELATLCMSSIALGLTPIVRVASAAAFHISAALDAGAQGVLVPHIDSAAEAAAAVRHAKYPPLGTRSIAAVGPHSGYRSVPLQEFTVAQNRETMVLALVESAGGVADADGIAATEGIDGIMIGPNDLSAELGIAGKLADPQIRKAYQTVASACVARRKHFVSGGVPGLDTRVLIALGSRFIIGATDFGYFMAAAQADVEAIRAAAS
jgi:2-keto-3-deoxy-L-rhamnonate aldolase RhmA